MSKEAIPGLVSVIIPTHNRAEMLERALTSVLQQEYQDLEIIVIADGCTDNSELVVGQFQDRRIQYISLSRSVGGAEARNIGLGRATGEYLAFIDDDDEWYPDKLRTQIALLREEANVAVVSCNYHVFDGRKNTLSQLPSVIALDDVLYRNYCGSFSFCLTRREFVGDLRINPVLRSNQDWDLWVKVLHATGKVCRVVQQPLVRYYHNHSEKLSNKHRQTYLSTVTFLRNHWHLMNAEQRSFQIYELSKRKRLYFTEPRNYRLRLRLYLKALACYRKSRYDQRLYNYLLLLTKIFPIRELLTPKSAGPAS